MQIISSIVIPIEFGLIGYFFLLIIIEKKYKYKDISFDISNGYRCFSCGNNIFTDEEKLDRLIKGTFGIIETTEVTMCKSCDRDYKLKNLFSINFISRIYLSFIKKILSKKFRSYLLYLIIAPVVFLVLDLVFILIFKVDKSKNPLGLITNLLYVIFWMVMIIRQRLTNRKIIDDY